MSEYLIFYKCTRPDGTDFYTGTVNYAEAYINKTTLVHPDPEGKTLQVCGRGFHVSPTARKTIKFSNKTYRPWRWWEVAVKKEHVIQSDTDKFRVSELSVVKEITLEDIFGPDFSVRIHAVQEEVKTWKNIPWFKPPKPVTTEKIQTLFFQWREAISHWAKNDCILPDKFRIVTDDAAAAAVDADAADVVVQVDRAAADVVAAAAAAAVDAAAAAAAVDADADAAAAADVVAAAAAADADVAAAAAADVAAAAAAADVAAAWKYYCRERWYIRPCYVLWRCERWKLAGMIQPNPWTPLVAMFKLGCRPIGYVKGEFVVYVPQP